MKWVSSKGNPGTCAAAAAAMLNDDDRLAIINSRLSGKRYKYIEKKQIA